MLRICISLINFYQRYLSFDHGLLQTLAPGGACKFSPSCSEYTKQSMISFGVIKGGLLGLKRIYKCR